MAHPTVTGETFGSEPSSPESPKPASPESLPPREARRRYVIMLVTAAVVLAVDHLTKWLVITYIALDAQVPASGPVTIHYIQNSGAAFGILPQLASIYLVVAAVVAGYILLYGPRMGGGLLRLLALGAVLGGAVSNGIDRLVSGHVTDFIDFHFWPIFNAADMAIVGGMLVVVYQLGFGKQEDVAEGQRR